MVGNILLHSTTPSGNIILRVVVLVKQLLGSIAYNVQLTAFCIVGLCGSAILVWGPYIATGVSLWRLKQYDYGGTDGDSSKANMNPALDVLYIMVVVQGAFTIYRTVLNTFVTKIAVTKVAKAYGLEERGLVHEYMREIHNGCAKNPYFSQRRNLVTYAVDLMGPDKLPEDYLSGLKILSTILGPIDQGASHKFMEQRMLIRQLMLYAPSNHIFRQLLVLSNPTAPQYGIGQYYGRSYVTRYAASLVLHIADGASQEQLPEVIQCISSMNGTFQESEYFPKENDYLKRMSECLHVLYVLTADENNCRLIIHTPGLLTKIMTPLTSDLYHQTDHEDWKPLVRESLNVMQQLTAAYGHGEGDTGTKLFRDTNLEVEAVKNMKRILGCDECSQEMETLAMGIVTNLHMQRPTTTREDFIQKMADIYTYSTTNSTRLAALEALMKLCVHDGSNAAIILQVNGSALYSFTDDLDTLSNGYNRCHMIVAEILQRACLHYTRDDECLKILKESMIYVIPKVVKKIFTPESTPTGQQGGALQNNPQNNINSSAQEHDIRKIQTSLLFLCVTVHETFISADQYLAGQFDDAIGEFSLAVKLREMVETNSYPVGSCLKLLKLASRMVISMMKCRGSRYPKQDLESLVEALSKACSRKMHFLDRSMDFASGDNAAKPGKPDRILASFLTEAMELVSNYGEPEVKSPSTIVGGELSSN
ncbi:uncharacterized protein LOC119282456 [Triticum dicoccoides]|uniref:uncharacterized protein LOC119282456 n=1 Tax=Triticum dicoccoides TaxID=85692 RepID=UPI00188F0255|nr:uncharacterized protein LOC119282456 [Triticum dicoccoides]